MARIMVVDDEIAIAQLLQEFLSLNGYDVFSQSDSKEACQAVLADESIGLVIMDIKMPGIRGVEIAQRWKDNQRDVPIIFLTGSINVNRYRQELRANGFTDSKVLAKPIDLQKILDIVKQYLPEPNK